MKKLLGIMVLGLLISIVEVNAAETIVVRKQTKLHLLRQIMQLNLPIKNVLEIINSPAHTNPYLEKFL